MQPTVGEILEGKVTGITKFGAFVALPNGKNGLVHISEIANTYVNDISEQLSEGQMVKVKIIGIGDDGKINLSIKKAEEQPHPGLQQRQRPQQPRASAPRQQGYSPRQAQSPSAEISFEDKLKQFMQESDSKISGNRLFDRKNNNRRRRD